MSNIEKRGFTIVELLIVIVVVAILAVISIVAYNGIQNRASDSSVRKDLASFGKKIKLAAVDNDERYPSAAKFYDNHTATGPENNRDFPGFTYSPAKNAYWGDASSTNNFYYCEGQDASSSNRRFVAVAKSRSGNVYRFSSDEGLQDLGSSYSMSRTNICSGFSGNDYTMTYGYLYTDGTWSGWTQ